LGPGDVSSWIKAQGGQVFTDESSRIVGVDLSYSWVTDGDMARLAQLSDLKTLELAFVRLTDVGIEQLRSLPNVEYLNLHSAEHVTDFAMSYLRGWEKLKRLNVQGTDITDTGLAFLAENKGIESLNISFTQVTDDGLEYLLEFRELKDLAVGGNKISATGLMALRLLPNLVSVDVSGIQRRNSGQWKASITDLDLELFGSLTELRELKLAYMSVRDAGLVQLSRLMNLQSLDLSNTQVSGKGLATIAGLPRLESLRLWNVKGVDDEAVPYLLEMPNLAVLDLANTGVTDEGLLKLAGKKGLRRLYVAGAKVTPEGVAGFQQKNPDCTISWWKDKEEGDPKAGMEQRGPE